MAHNKKRPVDFGVLHSRLPLGALVSILHRVSGLFLVLLLPFAFAVLERSLASAAGFALLQEQVQHIGWRLVLILTVWAFAHHFFAGVRHLLQDIDIGNTRTSGRLGAGLVLLAGIATAAAVAWRCFV